jgi:large subunit ribosomal protein L6
MPINTFTGQMTLPLPPYLIAKHNEENRKINLSVGDPTIAHQRAMWGENFKGS